ncbi:MAG: hypothetical protein NTZ77_01840 [Caldiserica bacterium]|nr:hypothetical protein [Caldisericota bacterium]
MGEVVHVVRPDLHVALDCPADWTVMDLDEQTGLRTSDPSDPRIALQVTYDEPGSTLGEASERLRNGLPEDALCEPGTLRRGRVDADGRASPEGPPVKALSFTARDGSFSCQVLVIEDTGHRWTVRLETLQRKVWWQESRELTAMLATLLLL